MADYFQIGLKVSAPFKQKIKPRFTVDDLKKDFNVLSNNIAKDFIKYFNNKYMKSQTDIKKASELSNPKKPLTKSDLMKAVKRKKHIVFIDKNVVVHSVSISDIFTILEYGRVDQGILPNPQISEAFKSYKPLYKRHVKTLLLK